MLNSYDVEQEKLEDELIILNLQVGMPDELLILSNAGNNLSQVKFVTMGPDDGSEGSEESSEEEEEEG